MSKIMTQGKEFGGQTAYASSVNYSNAASGMTASNVQDAIDELKEGGVDKKMTQDEYDALSEDEKKNGTTYFVETDADQWDGTNIKYSDTQSVTGAISELNDTLTSYVTSTNVYCYGNNSATTLQQTTFDVPSGYTAMVGIPYSASGSTNAYTDLYAVAVSSSGTTGTVQTRWTSAIPTTAYVRVKVILVKED